MCPQKNDAFTVSDITNGNGALTYPVGLLSTDEIVLAGGGYDETGEGYDETDEGYEENSGYYLYSGQSWWASSPFNFNGYEANGRFVSSRGYADIVDLVNDRHGVRPVFNLKAEVLTQGSGTASDPYRISLTS